MLVVVRRLPVLRRHLDASGERQHDEHGGEPTMHVHCTAVSTIKLGSYHPDQGRRAPDPCGTLTSASRVSIASPKGFASRLA